MAINVAELEAEKVDNAVVRDLDLRHVFHSWSVQSALDPLVVAGGSGCRVWDYEGREYLDFSSQLVNTNLGHQHPRVVGAIKQQAGELATVSPAHANLSRGLAAERIVSVAPAGFEKVFFTNGGADAIENAIRMARLRTGRDKVLSAYRSYHGNTGTSIVATGDPRRVPNEYARGHVHFFGPYLYRTEFDASDEQTECRRALQHLRRTIECEGPGSIAAILLESIPGTAGVLVPPAGYLQGVRALADEFGLVLIFDEVMAGFGRTGRWFAFEHFNVVPDLVAFAKGVNSGYVPAGGVLMSSPVCEYFHDRQFMGGLTYSGHPLAMAAIVASVDAMKEEGVIKNAAEIGEHELGPRLQALAQRHSMIGEVRGLGVFHAIELVADKKTGEPLEMDIMGEIKGKLMERGLLTFVVANRIHVVPPCIVTVEEVDRAVTILDETLSALSRNAR